HIGEPCAQWRVGQEQIPQPLRFCLGFQFLDDWQHLPGRIRLYQFTVVGRFDGLHLVAQKRLGLVEQRLGARGALKVHMGLLLVSLQCSRKWPTNELTQTARKGALFRWFTAGGRRRFGGQKGWWPLGWRPS